MYNNKNVAINSFNCRGLRDIKKRQSIFQWLKKSHNGIIFLQETHCTQADEIDWTKDWGGKMYFSNGDSRSRGVATLFPNNCNLDIQVNTVRFDQNGRILLIECVIEGTELILANVYAPTKDHIQLQLSFISELEDFLQSYLGKNVLLGGDFNTCLNEKIDKKGGITNIQTTYNKRIRGLMENMNLVDIWRTRNPNELKFTRRERSRGGLVQARLDFWLVAEQISFQIKKCEIKPGMKSDHSLVKITIDLLHTQARGRSYWKFNNTLLKDQKYVEMIKNEITLIKNDVAIENKNILWDFIKCQIRTKTISFSKQKSRNNRETENKLDKLKYLEKQITDNQEVLNDYYETKTEWEALQTIKTDGIILRSKVQWTVLGERILTIL